MPDPDLDPVFQWAIESWNQLDLPRERANALNLLPDIPWRIRTRIRDVEGHLDKTIEAIIEVVDILGTDEAEQWLVATFPD
jgi:hypothetical protein